MYISVFTLLWELKLSVPGSNRSWGMRDAGVYVRGNWDIRRRTVLRLCNEYVVSLREILSVVFLDLALHLFLCGFIYV